MKKYYLFLFALLAVLGCKKSSTNATDDGTTPAVTNTMHIVINNSSIFSYNITEEDPTTNDFNTKDNYDVLSLDYSFTPKPGHIVTIEALSGTTSTMTATVTYKDKSVGTITPQTTSNGTGFSYSFTVPSN